MKTIPWLNWTALLVSGALCAGAQALEGDVPSRVNDAVTQGSWTENCVGSWAVRDIVRDYNRWEKCKIGIDSRLIQNGRSVNDFKTENITILATVETLAKKLNANVYVVRDFFYIAPELPDGVKISGSHHDDVIGKGPDAPKPDAPKKEEPPPPPGGKEKPPDAKKPDDGKPPARQPKEKPPATGQKPPAPGEKLLQGLRPITPGSGLAELPAVFPGLRPGSSPIIPWSHKSMKDAAADGKPIILMTYFGPDPKKMSADETKLQQKFDKDLNDPAGFFETLILEDPEVQAELKGQVNFILVPWNEAADSWPSIYTNAAKQEGAALFVLPKDASQPVLTWQQRNPQYTAKQLIAAVKPLLPKPDANKAKPEVAHADNTKKSDAPKNDEKPKSVGPKVRDE